MPTVFKIPEALAHKYQGAGYAIGAALNGQLIDFAYLRDVLPGFDGDYADSGGEALAAKAITDTRIGPTVREMQMRGEVFVGMCSCWEFVEI